MAYQVFNEKIVKGLEGVTGDCAVEYYQEWARDYDSDLEMVGYADSQPKKAAKLLMTHLQNSKDENCRVLDLCSGTGLVGEHLRQEGFKGILDGIDGSEKMLDVARQKKIYKDLFVEYLDITKGIQSGKYKEYDALLCIGSLGPKHLNVDFVNEFPLRVKSGGIIIFNVRVGIDVQDNIEQIEKKLDKLVKIGTIEEVAVDVSTFYAIPHNTTDPDRTPGTTYCYKKI